MSGSIEEGARAAHTFMDIMRSQPLSLALVVMNICLLGFLYYTSSTAARERHDEMALLYENRKFVGQLLAECAPVERRK